VGLHTGEPAILRLRPAEEDRGVRFVRTDLPDLPEIPADYTAIEFQPRRTTLLGDGAQVHTVEHVLSALSGLGVTNLDIEIDGSEVPGLDGSALPFVELLRRAEIAPQKSPRRAFVVDQPVFVDEGEASIVALPPIDGGLTISYTLSYEAPEIGTHFLNVRLSEETYAREIAPARTFVPEREVDTLLAHGLGKGASYENTLVVGAEGIVNNTSRFADEYVRHKVMDLIGDLFLLGADLQAHLVAVRTGHHTNMRLVEKLRRAMEQKEIAAGAATDTLLDIREIQRLLPHRYPFLLIDRVVRLEGYRRAVGIKNVSINEPFFEGHWPGQPVMPGVLQVEALAQLAGVLLLRRYDKTGKLAVLLSMDKVKVRRAVVPGDQLVLEVIAEKIRSRTAQVRGRASVAGEVSCEAALRFMLVEAT